MAELTTKPVVRGRDIGRGRGTRREGAGAGAKDMQHPQEEEFRLRM